MKSFETKRYKDQSMEHFVKPGKKQAFKQVEINKLNHTKEYLLELSGKTTIHGIGHFSQTERHPMEYVMWVVVILGSIGCTIQLCLSTYNRFNDNPTVISVERNYNEWLIPFPAAFICPLDKYDELRLDSAAQRLIGNDGSPEKMTKMTEFLKTVSHISYDNFDTLSPFSGDTSLPQSNFKQLMNEVKYNFTFNLRANGWARQNTSIQEMCAMKTMLSERGLCYGHNSPFSALHDRQGKPSTLLFCNATLEKEHNYLTVNRIERASAFELSQLYNPYEVTNALKMSEIFLYVPLTKDILKTSHSSHLTIVTNLSLSPKVISVISRSTHSWSASSTHVEDLANIQITVD